MEKIGELRERDIQREFEWEIEDFLQLSDEKDMCYESTMFFFCDATWMIRIYTNKRESGESVGWVSPYVVLQSLTASITVTYSFQLKTVDGKTERYAKFNRSFDKKKYGFGCHKYIPRSELVERKSELLPSGVLTIICTLMKSDTDNKVGSAIVDEFTQTEEETGVLKLQRHFEEILKNEHVSDVVLKVEDLEFKSHRCVLAARSPVFLAMMTHDTKEKNTGVVNIQDVDPNAFSDFLRYLYTGSVQIITSENAIELYIAADKYQVDDLKKSCLDYMLKNISVDNFCDVLNLSLKHSERDLIDVCSQFFIENTVAIITTPMWLTFLTKNPVAGNELHLKQVMNNMKNKN